MIIKISISDKGKFNYTLKLPNSLQLGDHAIEIVQVVGGIKQVAAAEFRKSPLD